MASEVVTATEDPVFAREEPMRLRVESGPLPLDVRVTADDGREVEVTSIKWECDTGNPMPRATIEMECFGALLDVEPTVILQGVRAARSVTLPPGLSTSQVRYLEGVVGDVLAELGGVYDQRGRLLRELEARGVSVAERDEMLAHPSEDVSPFRPAPRL